MKLNALVSHTIKLRAVCLEMCKSVKMTLVPKKDGTKKSFEYGEFWVFYVHFAAYCLLFNKKEMVEKYRKRKIIEEKIDAEQIKTCLRDHMNKTHIEVPMYCFDQHVKTTKKKKQIKNQSDKKFFIDEASNVLQEKLDFHPQIEVIKKIYQDISKTSYKRNAFVCDNSVKRKRGQSSSSDDDENDLFDDSTLETIQPVNKKIKQ